MTAVAEPPPPAPGVEEQTTAPLHRGEGVELLGPVHGSGYKEGAALVRRDDGQMVHLGPLMYALLEEADGRRDNADLAVAMSERLGRGLDEQHVVRLAEKLADQGLLAGTEHKAPPKRNPLLALRWKVLVTNPEITRRLTSPFTFLFRPWLMGPVLVGFLVVCWFVLFHKGVASATAQAFNSPALLLLVFGLAVASAGFHELGHAAACRYGGATPAGMGVGIYLVWPAFYTDVTDAYRLPKRSRLRVDLGGLYFNAVVADLTLVAWLLCRVDALLLLVALQLLEMVKQLSPVIRADGYHILSDATGIPDLFSHIGPTMRRLIPGRREPSALTGRARLLVTLWVLIVVPVLLSLAVSAVLLLPKLATNAWDSGNHLISGIPHQLGDGDILGFLASLLRLFALFMPVIGSALVSQKFARTTVSSARSWSEGSAVRRTAALAAGAAVIAGLAWAWWPAGQYQPVRATDRGTLVSLGQMVASPTAVARPAPAPAPARAIQLTPGRHLAVSMIPVGGATKQHPAMFVISQGKGKPAVAIVSGSAPDPSHASGGTFSPKPGDAVSTTAAPSTPPPTSSTSTTSTPVNATAFPFQLPAAPGPGGTQALATNTKDGGVLYDVAYSIVTVQDGAPVTNTNSAFAIAHCKACTTVAVSFQIVLIIGQSKIIAPINAAGALNYNCTACLTTAIADQIVVTLKSQPSKELAAQLAADLKQLDALPELGSDATPAAVASAVAAVQQEIETQLHNSGLLTTSSSPSSSTSDKTTTSSSSSSGSSTTSTSSSAPPTASTPTGSTTTTPASTTPAPATTTTTATPSSTTTTTTPTATTTTTSPSAATTATP